MKTLLAAAMLAIMATGASAATTGTWNFSLNGGGFFGSVSFTGTDQNNDGIISGTDVIKLRGTYGGGTLGGPSQFGLNFDQTFASLSYKIDGVFGDTGSDFVSYSNDQVVECDFEICGPGEDGLPQQVFVSSSFYFAGDFVSARHETNGTPDFIIYEKIGPQSVNGPISEISAVPLSASSGFLLAGLAGLLTFGRRRKI